MDISKLIQEHNLKVMPILLEGCWSAGRVACLNAYTNGVPYENLVKAPTLEEAVKLAIEKELSEEYIKLNKKYSKMKKRITK